MASEAEEVSNGYDSDVIWSDNPEMAYFQSMIEKGGDQDSLAADVMKVKPEAGVMESGEKVQPKIKSASMSRRPQNPSDVDRMKSKGWASASESSDIDTESEFSHMADSYGFSAKAPPKSNPVSPGRTTDSYGFSAKTDSLAYPDLPDNETNSELQRSEMSTIYGSVGDFVKDRLSWASESTTDKSKNISSMSEAEAANNSRPPLLSMDPNEKVAISTESTKSHPPRSPSGRKLETINDIPLNSSPATKDKISKGEESGRPPLPSPKSPKKKSAKSPKKKKKKSASKSKKDNGDTKQPANRDPSEPPVIEVPASPFNTDPSPTFTPVVLPPPSPDHLVIAIPPKHTRGYLPRQVHADSQMSVMSNVSSLDSFGFPRNWWNLSSLASTLSNPSAAKVIQIHNDAAEPNNPKQDSMKDQKGRRKYVPGFVYLGGASPPNTGSPGDKSSEPDSRSPKLYCLKSAVIILLCFVAIAEVK